STWPTTTSRFRRCRGRLSRSCRRTSGGWGGRFQAAYTEEQQREGVVEYNYRRGGHAMDVTPVRGPVAELAAMAGTDAATYTRERPGMSARSRTASSTTPIPLMRADWTASGACTSGSTALPRGATRRASGGAATTSTTRAKPNRGCGRSNRETGDL